MDGDRLMEKLYGTPYLGNNLTEEEKISVIEIHFTKILKTLGLDLDNDSLQKTPHRLAKMYAKELFNGLESKKFPKITVQSNEFKYDQMLIESNISIESVCEHHFVPIIGRCHIAYIPKYKVIGLSKLNRVAKYFSRRPQVQERLTQQIKNCLTDILETEDVAVTLDAVHFCVKM
jgi:GTP cyclohydrolase I